MFKKYFVLGCFLLSLSLLTIPTFGSDTLSDQLSYITIRMPSSFSPLYRNFGLSADDWSGIFVIVKKYNNPKTFPEYASFKKYVNSYMIVYKFDWYSKFLNEGDIVKIAIPAGSYAFEFRLRDRRGGGFNFYHESRNDEYSSSPSSDLYTYYPSLMPGRSYEIIPRLGPSR